MGNYDYYERLIEKNNREVNEYNSRNVNRYNPSTQGNYKYFDPFALNNQTYYANNGQYSNHYNVYR